MIKMLMMQLIFLPNQLKAMELNLKTQDFWQLKEDQQMIGKLKLKRMSTKMGLPKLSFYISTKMKKNIMGSWNNSWLIN